MGISQPIVGSVHGGLNVGLAGLPVLVVQAVTHSIHFGPVAQQVPVICVGLQVFEGHQQQAGSHDHPLPDFLVRAPIAVPPLHERNEVRHVVGHLRSGGGCPILVVEHPVVELPGHTNDHVVEVGVEGLALGDVHTIGWLEVVARHDVVDVCDSSGPHTDFGEVSGPHTAVGILGLVLTEVGGVNVVVDVPITLVPLLVVVLLVVMVGGVDREVLGHPGGQLELLVDLVQQIVVLLADHTVAVAAVAREHLEA
jgi:hypothetical protein